MNFLLDGDVGLAPTNFHTVLLALLLAFLRWRGAPVPTWAQWRSNTFIGAFLLLGGNGLVAWAEKTVPSGLTALLIGVQPLFFVLTEWAWPGGTRPGAITFGALLLGFAGVAWLAAPWEDLSQSGLDLGGTSMILLACVFWAFGSIYSRHAKHGADPLLAAASERLLRKDPAMRLQTAEEVMIAAGLSAPVTK